MDWIVIYLVGCGFNVFMILLHVAFGYLTVSGILKSNYRKIGLNTSYLGGISSTPFSLRPIVLDCLMSWIAAVVNVVTLLRRCVMFVGNLSAPKELKDIAFKLSRFNLSVEEVLCLELEAQYFGSGTKYTYDDIAELRSTLRESRGVEVDLNTLMLLISDKCLIQSRTYT